MGIKYRMKSGREYTYEELKKWFFEVFPDKTENDFEWDLYFAIEIYKTIQTV